MENSKHKEGPQEFRHISQAVLSASQFTGDPDSVIPFLRISIKWSVV